MSRLSSRSLFGGRLVFRPPLSWLWPLVLGVACAAAPEGPAEPWSHFLPRPVSAQPSDGGFTLAPQAQLSFGSAELEPVATLLASTLRTSTGFALPVSPSASGAAIDLAVEASRTDLGDEGYELTVTPSAITVRAATAAGVFYGTQTLRQLFPSPIERSSVQPGPWRVSTGTLRDLPRFAWRGVMVDVARHFFAPSELHRLIEVMAHFKLNRLHLHLTDDQGWRLQLEARPALTGLGASTQVGGGPGGFYTKAEYTELVQYAAQRFVTVVPEIDLPGHTNAALASLPELNCDGGAPAPYTGTTVGLSSLCVGLPATAAFVHDVITEVAAMTPGQWIHVGGDEAKQTSLADYQAAIALAREAVAANGKQLIGWEELARADAGEGTIVQHWLDPALASAAAARGAKVVLSPARRAYLDMQYAPDQPLGVGTFWAGYDDVITSWDWDPGLWLPEVPEAQVLGVEGAVWTEFIATPGDLEAMLFPRALGLAELGWSAREGHSTRDYAQRLGAFGPRFDAWGVRYFAAPTVPWAP
jgi:hexosaminidase